jgi:hypothetical protein
VHEAHVGGCKRCKHSLTQSRAEDFFEQSRAGPSFGGEFLERTRFLGSKQEAALRQAQGWRHTRIEPDRGESTVDEPHTFNEPKLAELYAFWRARRGERPYPDRADLDPVDMRAWLGHLMLVEYAETRWTYRLYGTYFVETFRREMTGKSIDELPDEQARLLREEYDRVRNGAAPVFRTYSALFEFGTLDGRKSWQLDQTWERISLPLSDRAKGDDAVRLVLVGAYLIGGHES